MTVTTSSKPSVFVSVRWLLIIGFTLMLTVILAGIFYWFYQFATRQALDHVRADLTQAVQIAALNIDGDELLALSKDGKPNEAGIAWQEAKKNEAARQTAIQKFGSANDLGFSDDPRYQHLLDQMDIIHQIEPRAWPYLWVNTETESEIIYVVGLAARYNPEQSTYFMEKVGDIEPTTELALSTNEQGELESYVDEWGEWYSAWMPINDSNGKLIGGIGVDFVAGEVDQVQHAIRNIVLAVFAFTYFLMFLAVFWVSKAITGPILSLTQAADAVGEGNYEQDFARLYEGRFLHNEVGVLARVFSLMVAKVQNRVEALQQQVLKLRVEIDQAKRKDEVDEIVNTDFFRDLKDKAKAVRNQRHASDSQEEK